MASQEVAGNRPPFLTEDRAIELLREVVAEDPDLVYRRHPPEEGKAACRYAYNGRGDCLVGCVLVRHGWDVDRLAYADGPVDDCALFEHHMSRRARTVLVAAQAAQDGGKPWSAALVAAEKEYAGLGSY